MTSMRGHLWSGFCFCFFKCSLLFVSCSQVCAGLGTLPTLVTSRFLLQKLSPLSKLPRELVLLWFWTGPWLTATHEHRPSFSWCENDSSIQSQTHLFKSPEEHLRMVLPEGVTEPKPGWNCEKQVDLGTSCELLSLQLHTSAPASGKYLPNLSPGRGHILWSHSREAVEQLNTAA